MEILKQKSYFVKRVFRSRLNNQNIEDDHNKSGSSHEFVHER